MRFQLTPIHCRPWLVAYLSVKLIESHYENNYGGALRRLNAITEQLERLRLGEYTCSRDQRAQAGGIAELHSIPLCFHELYFQTWAGNGAQATGPFADALCATSDRMERWRMRVHRVRYVPDPAGSCSYTSRATGGYVTTRSELSRPSTGGELNHWSWRWTRIITLTWISASRTSVVGMFLR